MSGNAVWLVVAVLAACAVVAWLLLKRGRDVDVPAPPADAATTLPAAQPLEAMPASAAPVETPPPVAPATPVAPVTPVARIAPAPAPVVVQPSTPALPREAPATPPIASRPSAPPAAAKAPPPRQAPPQVLSPPPVAPAVAPRPPPVVIERVLALEPATAAEWDAARALSLLPAQAAAVAAAVAVRSGTATLQCVVLEPGMATAIARGDLERMRSLSSAHGAGPRKGAETTWLDSQAATALVAAALAALASERFLAGLGDEVRELKAAVASLPPRLATQGGASFKTLMQDLSRFTREARDNYASAIGKLAFRERVGETEDRAVELWRETVVRVDAIRQQMDTLASSPRFGEVQVEKGVALYRDLQDQRSLQDIAGRVLAGARLLRVSIGDAAAAGRADPLASALAALQAGQDQDAELATRLAANERIAKGDPYVGKAEFEANRATLRKAIERISSVTSPAAGRLDAARGAVPLDAAGTRHRKLVVGPAGGGAIGLRWLEQP